MFVIFIEGLAKAAECADQARNAHSSSVDVFSSSRYKRDVVRETLRTENMGKDCTGEDDVWPADTYEQCRAARDGTEGSSLDHCKSVSQVSLQQARRTAVDL